MNVGHYHKQDFLTTFIKKIVAEISSQIDR